MMLHNVNNNLV